MSHRLNSTSATSETSANSARLSLGRRFRDRLLVPARLVPAGIARTQALLLALLLVGCASPYHADRGALVGGVLGAGTGALIGDAVGSPLAGTAIGAGVGAISGAAIGGGLDEIEARNRAEIQSQLGQPVRPGAVSIGDVVAMTQAGVEDSLIITHIQAHGAARPLTSQDLIQLRQAGVSPGVVQQLQQSPPAPQRVAAAPPYYAPPPPIIVEEYYYGPPVYYGHPRRYHGPRTSWGFSYSR